MTLRRENTPLAEGAQQSAANYLQKELRDPGKSHLNIAMRIMYKAFPPEAFVNSFLDWARTQTAGMSPWEVVRPMIVSRAEAFAKFMEKESQSHARIAVALEQLMVAEYQALLPDILEGLDPEDAMDFIANGLNKFFEETELDVDRVKAVIQKRNQLPKDTR